jgi:serine protease Do
LFDDCLGIESRVTFLYNHAVLAIDWFGGMAGAAPTSPSEPESLWAVHGVILTTAAAAAWKEKMTKRLFRFVLLFIVLTLGIVACSGGGEEPTATTADEPTAAPTQAPTNTPEPAPTDAPTEAPTNTPEPPATPSSAVTSRSDVDEAVVQIVAEGTFIDPEYGLLANAAGSGSGFIIDPTGLAVTNNHVVTGAALLDVYLQGEDRPRNARILGVSECSDLAVIDIEENPGEQLPYLVWYEGPIETGLEVYTAGFPLGSP